MRCDAERAGRDGVGFHQVEMHLSGGACLVCVYVWCVHAYVFVYLCVYVCVGREGECVAMTAARLFITVTDEICNPHRT